MKTINRVLIQLTIVFIILFCSNYMHTLNHELMHKEIAERHGYDNVSIKISTFGFSGLTSYKVNDGGSENYRDNKLEQHMVDIIDYQTLPFLLFIVALLLILILKES